MRHTFKDPHELKHRNGECRIITKFLWFPTYIKNEIRWMEKAKIKQQIQMIDIGGSGEWGKYEYDWVDIRFL